MKKHLFTIASLALGFFLNAQVCLNPSAGSPFSLAQQPFSITSADFNSDGKADLATADRNNSSVSILLGDGVGSFTSTTSFTVGSFPNSITNADFNADGKIDLATTNNGSSNVSILLGDGAGNFTATTSISVGSAPSSITKGDFNLDSKVDLAIANNSSNTISILLGNGLGGFAAAVNFNTGIGPISVISADFNSDSKLDLGVANATSNNVSILLGNGAGSFSTAVNFSAGTFPRSIINGDFNADGKVDLATANDQSNNVSVLIGDGNGNFAPSVLYSVGTNPYSVTSGDFNSDGKVDLATANVNSNNISVLLGNGTGSFATAVNFAVGSTARSVISVDFNADGRDDLASANFISSSIFLNQTPFVIANSTATVVCAGTNITLSGSGATTYTWSGGVSDGIPFIPTATTTYTVIGTDVNGCTNSAVKNITVNPLPTVNAGSDQTLNCSTSTVALVGSASPSSCTPVWTGGVTSGANSYSATVSTIGTYTLTVTDPSNGCSESDQVLVSSSVSIPTITISVSNTLTCLTTTANSSVITSAALPTYVWSGPSVISGGTTSNAIVDQPGVYTVTVTDIPTGCSNTATTIVTQNTISPSPTASTTGTITCFSPTVSLVGGPASGVTYLWSGPGFSSGTSSQNASATSAGNYTLLVTSSINGCTNIAVTSVTQNTTTPSLSASTNTTSICSGSSATISATGVGANTYVWNPGNLSGATRTVSPSSTTQYTVTGTNTVTGCSAFANITITVNPLPTINAGPTKSLTCASTFTILNGSSVGGSSYNWNGPGIVSGYTMSNCNVNGVGTYSVFAISANGCASSIATVAVVLNKNAPIVSASSSGSITCVTSTVALTGGPASGVTYLWSGPGFNGGTTSQSAEANAAGSYTLKVTSTVNSCTNSATTNVVQNTVPPNPFANSSGTVTCSSPTVTLNALPVSGVTYLWSGTGITGSTTTQTTSVNAGGNYTLSITSLTNGCASNATVNVSEDITAPFINIAASPSIICNGSTTTLTASSNADPVTIYVWTPGSLNGSVQSVSPLTTTLYSVVVTNTLNGCSNTETVNINVNSLPTLAITGNTNICKGSTSTLTASGATSYTWNSGANTTSISVTPTITTTYTVTGDNGAGSCIASLPITVSIIPNKTINGIITSTAGATNGDIILYKYNIGLSYWDSVTTVPFTNSYSFTDIDSAQYVLRAIPTATNIQVTYGANSISWQNATIISHGCSNNSIQNIDLIAFENFTPGPGILSGKIVEGDGFGQTMRNEFKPLAPGEPIGGIVVKGGRNPGGQMFTQTITDAAGQYTLTGFPVNTGTENYFVFVDIPGLDTNGTYHRVISTGNSQFENLNFIVDSMYIHPVGVASAINSENTILNNSIIVYPNPASNQISIKYELINTATIKIELFDLLGQKVKDICVSNLQEKNKYSYSTNLEDLSSGVYFIKFMVNKTETSLKLIVTN